MKAYGWFAFAALIIVCLDGVWLPFLTGIPFTFDQGYVYLTFIFNAVAGITLGTIMSHARSEYKYDQVLKYFK